MSEEDSTLGEDAQQSAPESVSTPELTASREFSELRGFQWIGVAPTEMQEFQQELSKELVARAQRFVQSVDDSILLSSDGVIRWLGDPVARIVAGDELLKPRAVLLADDALPTDDREAIERRLSLWVGAHVKKLLGPLEALSAPHGSSDGAAEIAAKLVEALGVLERERVRQQVKALDQNSRAALRKLGVRFGAHYIFVPALMKPAPRALSAQLWSLKHGAEPGAERLMTYAAAGRTSFTAENGLSAEVYRVAGFRLCGERVVRVDIVERLTDLVRAAIPDLLRPGNHSASPGSGFVVTQQMTSLTGCAGEAFASILRSLGFESHMVKKSEFDAARRISSAAESHAANATPPVESAPAGAVIEGGPVNLSAENPSDALSRTDLVAAPDGHIESATDAAAVISPDREPEMQVQQEEGPSPIPVEAQPTDLTVPASSADSAPFSISEEETATPAQSTAAVEEDPLVEIWRPAPRRRHGPGQRQLPAPGVGRIVWRAQEQKDQKRKISSSPPSEIAPVAEAAPTVVVATQDFNGARPENHGEFGQNRGERRPANKGPHRDERRDQRSASGDRPQRKEPRETVVDPDSPFAKLAALKPLLERRDKRT